MKSKFLVILLIMSFLFIIPGCAAKPRTCSASELQAVTLLEPSWDARDVSLTPTLSWEYPTSPDGCLPEKYQVTLRVRPFFTDNLGGDTPGPVTAWTPAAPLQPGTEYLWGIRPMVGDVLGPNSSFHYFFTGPACASDALVAPNLLFPADAAVITDPLPEFVWEYPQDCAPDEYLINLSTSAESSDPNLDDWETTGDPSTGWLAWPPLDDCTTYYWKVRALTGSTPSPASSTFSFRLDETGACQPAGLDWPVFRAKMNASCRIGPGIDYNVMDYLMAGDTRPAEGRNENSSWLLLRLDADRKCWIALSTGGLEGDPTILPFASAPPLLLPGPTGSPTPTCSAYQDENSCKVNSGCKWVSQVLAPSYCTNQ